MGEDAVDELARHFGGALRVVVERGDGGEDDCASVGGELHVAQVDAIEWGLADAEDERAALFEGDVSGALDEVGGEAGGDGGERAHGAGKDDHRVGGVAAAGDVGADVGLGMLLDFFAGCAEEFFDEAVASAELEFFGEDAEGVVGDDEVDFGYARVGGEGAEHLGGVDASAGSGDG